MSDLLSSQRSRETQPSKTKKTFRRYFPTLLQPNTVGKKWWPDSHSCQQRLNGETGLPPSPGGNERSLSLLPEVVSERLNRNLELVPSPRRSEPPSTILSMFGAVMRHLSLSQPGWRQWKPSREPELQLPPSRTEAAPPSAATAVSEETCQKRRLN